MKHAIVYYIKCIYVLWHHTFYNKASLCTAQNLKCLVCMVRNGILSPVYILGHRKSLYIAVVVFLKVSSGYAASILESRSNPI